MMMRRMLCFLLVLIVGLSVVSPVLAVRHNSPGDLPPFPPFPTRPSEPSEPSDNPKTGDQIMMYVIIMLIAMAALAVVLLFSRKFFGK